MQIVNYDLVKDALIARQPVWDPEGKLTPAFFALEILGEFGELCNVIKKMRREALGIVGSRATEDDLRYELADVYMTLVNIGISAGIEADAETEKRAAKEFGEHVTDVDSALGTIGMCIGAIASAFLLNSAILDDVGDPPTIEAYAGAIVTVKHLAKLLDLNLRDCVVTKFNNSSQKLNLPVRLLFATKL